jgi:hypothetical protein
MKNASDERALKLKQLQDSHENKVADGDFRWLMSDQRGRRIIWNLMGRCNVFSPVFNTHGGLMNFNEGRRDTGLFLLGEIDRLCPDLFSVMAGENARKPEEENDD